MDVALKTCKLEGASHAEIWMAYMSNELKTLWKRSSSYWRTVHSRKWLAVNRRVRLPFCVLKVLGDVLDDGELHFIERARTFEAARRRIEALAECNGSHCFPPKVSAYFSGGFSDSYAS